MNTSIPIQELLTRYSDVLANFYNIISKTSDAELFGWESESTQTERFRVLLDEVQNRLRLREDNSLVDVGCGHADLYKYMLQNRIKAKYTGIDFKKEYIRECKKRFPLANFIQYDILSVNNAPLGLYDVICMSGVLNLNIDSVVNIEGQNLRILEYVLSVLMPSTKKGLVCNFLHANSEKKDDFFAYHQPNELISYIENLGYEVLSLQEGYLPNDFTLTIINNLNDGEQNSEKRKLRSISFTKAKDNDAMHFATEVSSEHTLTSVSVYTDGGCSGNPGIGAWAFYVPSLTVEKFGNEQETTSNRMELTATIEALTWACEQNIASVSIYTDSQYIQKGVTEWSSLWEKNNWKTSSGKSVKNQDLWRELLEHSFMCSAKWHWVKGHAGHDGNERAHKLVTKGINALK